MFNNKIVRLNIGGTSFKCFSETLVAFPESRLANLDKQQDAFDMEQNEYFFDRNPILFAYILDSIRKGAVHLPKDICGITFRRELEFWNIPPLYVAPCCFEAMYSCEDDIATVKMLQERIQHHPHKCLMQAKLSVRSKLWLFLDEPRSSRLAMLWNVFISLVIVVATLSESLSSIDKFQENFTEPHVAYLSQFAYRINLDNVTLSMLLTSKPQNELLMTDVICNSILSLEFLLSFIVCENKKCFFSCLIRVMTCFGYASYWISVIVYGNAAYFDSVNAVMVYLAFGYLSIFRLARLFYLTKNVNAFKIICLTFRSSKKELSILVFLLGILICVFGFLMYAAEFFQNSKVNNIFTAIYWALITATTVGYGDYVPKSIAGHVIASACAICGVIVLALPVGIIVSKFYRYYEYYSLTFKHAQYSKETQNNKTENQVADLSDVI